MRNDLMTLSGSRVPLLLIAALLALALPAADRATDRDHDGIDDAVEDALLSRYAPVVLLHPTEPVHPSSTEWLLARAELEPAGNSPRTLQASVLGALATLAWPQVESPSARLHAYDPVLEGSRDPHDWAVYGHAFRAAGGGVILQYWFFYPYNRAYGLFDHGGDWEHVAVKLDAALRPEGAFYARHEDSHPGEWFGWDVLRKEGDHPVVLAGRGTHASYATRDDAPFWERLCEADLPSGAAAAHCDVWRTGSDGAGVVNVGERSAPRVGFITWPGRWGATGRFGEDSRTASPPGPAFQGGWCSGGAPGACP